MEMGKIYTATFALTIVLSLVRLVLGEDALKLVLEPQLDNLGGVITDIQHAGDDRLFVVSKDGRIQIIQFNPQAALLLNTPFLDISNRVKDSGERGLLGLAFHPNYADNGYFFVHYIHDDPSISDVSCSTATGDAKDSRISRFHVPPSNPNVADPNSELIVAIIPQPFCNHNGGQVLFGHDNFLYLALGDGGSGNDPQNNALDLNSLLGKILRVDIDNMDEGAMVDAGTRPRWTIPTDNPYAASTNGARGEIWLSGLRNPWRCSFDRRTQTLWIGDVGQGAREEVDVARAGGDNFGWRACEGTRINIGDSFPEGCSSCSDNSCFVPPILEYGRSVGASITGGYVYRGTDSNLNGTYLYGDFGSGMVWGARDGGEGTWSNVWDVQLSSPTTFGENVAGDVFVGTAGGGLYRVVLEESDGPNESTSPTKSPTNSGSEELFLFTLPLVGILFRNLAAFFDWLAGILGL